MTAAVPCLLLIDGHAAAYRFFHGIRPMYTHTGVPVQAVFGFIRMLELLRKHWRPTHLAVALDGGLPASRLQLVPEYKAQRKPMPDELRMQLPIIQEYLAAAAIPFFRLDAVEADDVIATLARRADGTVRVGTSDKDLFQLVNDRIGIVPLSGLPELLDAEGVEAKTGVRPAMVPDWLALTGDAADNIRGVPGIGPKTAAALLQQFGSLDAIYASLGDVSRDGIREALASHESIVRRNREMVALIDAIEGLPSFEALICKPDPVAALQAFYGKYAFESFARKLREPELF